VVADVEDERDRDDGPYDAAELRHISRVRRGEEAFKSRRKPPRRCPLLAVG
jgi:hypothetical protein